ncbi:hypothetical protein Lser_V15G01827 [Lactuca serriola]
MATSPFLIFSKTQNFFNRKSIANPTRRPILRAHSPSGRFYTSPSSNSFASSNSAFSSSPSSFFQNRSASPTRVNVYGSSPSASNIRFSLNNRQISPSRSIFVIPRSNNSNQASKKQLDKPRRMLYDPHIPELEKFIHKDLFFPSNKFSDAFHEDYVGKLFDEMPGDEFWSKLKAIRWYPVSVDPPLTRLPWYCGIGYDLWATTTFDSCGWNWYNKHICWFHEKKLIGEAKATFIP